LVLAYPRPQDCQHRCNENDNGTAQQCGILGGLHIGVTLNELQNTPINIFLGVWQQGCKELQKAFTEDPTYGLSSLCIGMGGVPRNCVSIAVVLKGFFTLSIGIEEKVDLIKERQGPIGG